MYLNSQGWIGGRDSSSSNNFHFNLIQYKLAICKQLSSLIYPPSGKLLNVNQKEKKYYK